MRKIKKREDLKGEFKNYKRKINIFNEFLLILILLSNLLLFCLNITVPPKDPVIIDESGKEVSHFVGPYMEGSALTLHCEVRGGKWFNTKDTIRLESNIYKP